jgi:hypothetical protein
MPGATMHENRGSKAGEVLWAVADDELETLPRNQVCRAVEQAFSRKPVKRKVRGGCSAFFKVYEHTMSSGRRVYQSEEGKFRSGKPNRNVRPSRFRTRR